MKRQNKFELKGSIATTKYFRMYFVSFISIKEFDKIVIRIQ